MKTIRASELPCRDQFTQILLEDAARAVALYRETMGRTLQGAHVLDIGAHHGTFALTAIEDGAAHVLAVEASIENFMALVANATSRQLDEERLRALHLAAWEGRDGKISLRRIPVMVNTGQYSVAFDPERYPEAELVRTVAFTELLRSNHYVASVPLMTFAHEPWDYVKIDVEGAEWSWLTGPPVARAAMPYFRVLDIELHPLSNAEYYPAQATEPFTLSDVDQWFRAAGCRIVWREESPTRLFIITP